MHFEVYRQRPDVNAVIHAHPVSATALSVAGMEFPNRHSARERDALRRGPYDGIRGAVLGRRCSRHSRPHRKA